LDYLENEDAGTSYGLPSLLSLYLDPNFETRLPTKENGAFNLAVEDEKNFKEAADLKKKVMC
jgi:hypothetical protein